MDEQSITSKIASWATALTPEAIPEPTRHAAQRSLYNYFGCVLHGSSHPTVSRALTALEPFFGPSTASLFGRRGSRRQADAQHAALLNGIASHVHDYDDTHLATIIHPTGCVASALLAGVQHARVKVSGPALLTALVVGIEVACKLGLAVYPRHYDAGWHITSTTGSIGAAAALCNLWHLTESQTAHAVGVAATQVTGLRCNFGSDTKSLHVGRAAQNGLLAVLLAQQGFTAATPNPLEARRGWANVVTGGTEHNIDLDIPAQLHRYITTELGFIWEIDSNSFKPFPCGIVAHPAIDAAIQLRPQLLLLLTKNQELESLTFTARVHPLVVELTNNPTPTSGLEAKFSVHHGVAVALVLGSAGPEVYDDDDVVTQNKLVGVVRGNVTTVADQSLNSDEAVLEAYDQEGKEMVGRIHVEHAVGSLAMPMTDAQLEQKFIGQVLLDDDVNEEKAREWSEVCWGLGRTDNVVEGLDLLSK